LVKTLFAQYVRKQNPFKAYVSVIIDHASNANFYCAGIVQLQCVTKHKAQGV